MSSYALYCIIVIFLIAIIALLLILVWRFNNSSECTRKSKNNKPPKPDCGLHTSVVDFATKSKIAYRIPIIVETNNGEVDDVNFITITLQSQEFQLTDGPKPDNITNDINSFVQWDNTFNFTTDGSWDKASFVIPNNYNNTSPSGRSKLTMETQVCESGSNTVIYIILTLDLEAETYLVGRISANSSDIYPGNLCSVLAIEKIE